MNKYLKYFSLVFISLLVMNCEKELKENGTCLKYSNERYLEQTTDTSIINGALRYHEILLNRFGENSIKGLKYEVYHIQFYSSHGYGQSVRFENKNGSYSLNVKCKSKEEWFEECKEYQIKISEDDWEQFEKMIYEFNFWTSEDFRANNNVLDGYVFFIEGNRPEAEECNKKKYKLVGRGSPRYDKMEALFDNIIEYEDQLKFKYEQMNRIK